VDPRNHVFDRGPDPPREGALLRGHMRQPVVTYQRTVNVSAQRTGWMNTFTAARMTRRRCGLLSNYFGQLLFGVGAIVNECLVTIFQPEAGHFEVNPAAGTLRIVNVARADKGNYACVVNTTGHPVIVSGNAHLYVESTISHLCCVATFGTGILIVRWCPAPSL